MGFLPIDAVNKLNMRTKFDVILAGSPLPVTEIIGGTLKFGQPLDTPTIPFYQTFNGFVRMDTVNVPAKFELRSFTRA